MAEAEMWVESSLALAPRALHLDVDLARLVGSNVTEGETTTLDRAGTGTLHLMVNLWDVTTRPVSGVYPNRLKTRPISSHMLLITAPEGGTRMVSPMGYS